MNLAEVELSKAKKELLLAEREDRESLLALQGLMGHPPDITLPIEGDLPSEKPALPDRDTLKNLVFSQRPDLKAALREVEKSQLAVSLVNKEAVPNITVAGFYNRDERKNEVGIGFSLPIPFFDRKQAEKREALVKAQQAGIRADGIKKEIWGHFPYLSLTIRNNQGRTFAMPRIARIIAPHYPHHITQRGNNRGDVFFDDEDKSRYLSILKDHCEKWAIELWAYCLMNNHLHILAVPTAEESLSRCIGRTNLMYTQYANRKYKRSGRLWQNRFFSTIVDTESSLWSVTRYIEQNPVKSALVKRPEDYPWSSCRANISGQGDGLVTGREWLDEKDRTAYRIFLMQQDPIIDQKIRTSTSTGRPLGSEDFLARLEDKLCRKILPGKAGRPRKSKLI